MALRKSGMANKTSGFSLVYIQRVNPGPNFIELLIQTILLNKFLLSKTWQGTHYRLFMQNGILAGNHILLSII